MTPTREAWCQARHQSSVWVSRPSRAHESSRRSIGIGIRIRAAATYPLPTSPSRSANTQAH